jgi:mRNA interferase YafQ
MREIKFTKRFQRDYKREKSAGHSKNLDAQLMAVVNLLVADTTLPRRNLITLCSEWNDHRDCQVRPDLHSQGRRGIQSSRASM